MTSIDLTRISDTWANIRGNLDDAKLALMTDDDLTLTGRIGSNTYKFLAYSQWNGVVQSVIKTGTKIYTDSATTGLANQQLDLALSELRTTKIEVDNGTATGTLDVENLEASGSAILGDASVNKAWELGNSQIADFSSIFNSALNGVDNVALAQHSTGSTILGCALGKNIEVKVGPATALLINSDSSLVTYDEFSVKPDGTNERLYVSDAYVQLNGTDGVSGYVFNTVGGSNFYENVVMGSGTKLDTISGDFMIKRNTVSPALNAGLLNIVGTAGDATLLIQYHDGTYRYSATLTKEV